MKGTKTADVMRLVVTTCCVRLMGSGARAEKLRMAECARLDRMMLPKTILKGGFCRIGLAVQMTADERVARFSDSHEDLRSGFVVV